MADRIVIAAVGDVIVTRPLGPGVLLTPLRNADYRVGNLEGPITDKGTPADKPITLRMPAGASRWLRELGLDAVSLANNHTLDYGVDGLQDTLAELRAAGIGYAGAGSNLEESLRPHIAYVKGVRVAQVCLAATIPPGFAAGPGRPGIAPVRVRVSFGCDGSISEEQPGTPPWVHTQVVEEALETARRAVAFARQEADIVLVQMHWGVPPEWNSPFQGALAEYQRPLAHALVDAGADVILGHHPHAPQGVEIYGEGIILYSLGNFIFHPYTDREALTLQRPAPPYQVAHTEKNRYSLVARLHFGRADSSWRLEQVELVPGWLNENAEAEAVEEPWAQRIFAAVEESTATVNASLKMTDGRAWVVRPEQ
ncbi:MAG: CapA family protein [Firmicutes bacterium]|nr:CapA family protein [Bacillota bacterium]